MEFVESLPERSRYCQCNRSGGASGARGRVAHATSVPFVIEPLRTLPILFNKPSFSTSLPPAFPFNTSLSYAQATPAYQISRLGLQRQQPSATALSHHVRKVTLCTPFDPFVSLSFTLSDAQPFSFNASRTPFGTLGPLQQIWHLCTS